HRQIESMLKLDLLRLRQAKGAGDVGERLLRKDDCSGTHHSNRADELNVFDRLGETLQTAAILFEKAQARAIDLTVEKQTDETRMAQAGREGQLSLRYVKRRLGVAEWAVVKVRRLFVRSVA